jgi:hypothetical protein
VERHLCEQCLKEYYKAKKDNQSVVPVFTIAGVALGLLSGIAIAIPIFALGGFAIDVAIRCEKCGTITKNLFEVMDKKTNELGEEIIQSIPKTLFDPTRKYRIENGRLEQVKDVESMDNFSYPVEHSFTDFDVSYDTGMADDSLEGGDFSVNESFSGFTDGGDFGGSSGIGTEGGDFGSGGGKGSGGGGDLGSNGGGNGGGGL